MSEPVKILAALGACGFLWWWGFGVLLSYDIIKKTAIGRWTAIYWAAITAWIVFAELVLR